MIRHRAPVVALLLAAVALAGCSGDPPPAAGTPTPTATASLDRLGRGACDGIAALIREGNRGADANQLLAGTASASSTPDIAAAGDRLQRASIALAASDAGAADRGKLEDGIASAQQELLTACKAILGDEPW